MKERKESKRTDDEGALIIKLVSKREDDKENGTTIRVIKMSRSLTVNFIHDEREEEEEEEEDAGD